MKNWKTLIHSRDFYCIQTKGHLKKEILDYEMTKHEFLVIG